MATAAPGGGGGGGGAADVRLGPIEELRNALWGDLVFPGEPAWAEATKVWSYPAEAAGGGDGAAPHGAAKKPAVVVRARGTKDVVEAVKYARKHGLAFAVKGGGHTPANLGLADGGMTLDLSLMRGVAVDPVARTAVVDGGSLLGDIDRETALYNLCVPLGHAPVTGMGLALGGGVGIAARMLGPTCDHIVGATVVAADGQVHTLSASGGSGEGAHAGDSKGARAGEGKGAGEGGVGDQELLWGLRGAGAALGVVTKLVFRLEDISGNVGGYFVWPDDPSHATFKAVARWMCDVGYDLPGFGCNLSWSNQPKEAGGPVLMSQVAFLGSPATVESRMAALQPLRDLKPVIDNVRPGGYLDAQFAMMNFLKAAPPHFEVWATGNMPRASLTPAALDALTAALIDGHPPPHVCPGSAVVFDLWGKKLLGSSSPVALAAGRAELSWLALTGWTDPAHAPAAAAYSLAVRSAVGAAAHGAEDVDAFANFSSTAGEELGEERLTRRVGGAANLARLRKLKAKYDADNLFTSHPFKGLVPA